VFFVATPYQSINVVWGVEKKASRFDRLIPFTLLFLQQGRGGLFSLTFAGATKIFGFLFSLF
jgi:hypothetical protein